MDRIRLNRLSQSSSSSSSIKTVVGSMAISENNFGNDPTTTRYEMIVGLGGPTLLPSITKNDFLLFGQNLPQISAPMLQEQSAPELLLSNRIEPLQKRFKDKYRIKCHLSAGAHGIILWAVDRTISSNNGNNNNQSNPSSRTEANMLDGQSVQSMVKQYAIKRIFIRNRQVPLKLIREIKSLQFLRGHDNIIDILDVCPSGSSVNLVFPLLPTNLTALIYVNADETDRPPTDAQSSVSPLLPSDPNGLICKYFHMLLLGLHHLHQNGIVHRDLKPSNLLIDWSGTLKLADFGQARLIHSDHITNDPDLPADHADGELSNDVCTRWYRAPELLWGATRYGYEVDIWSAGCILAEMCQRWPLFKGETDIEQLSLLVRVLGQPEPHCQWTRNLPDFNKIQFVQISQVDQQFTMNDMNQSNPHIPLWLEKFHQERLRKINRNQTKPIDCEQNDIYRNHTEINRGSLDLTYLDIINNIIRYTNRWTTDQLLKHHYFHSALDFDPKHLIKPKSIQHLSGPPNYLNDRIHNKFRL